MHRRAKFDVQKYGTHYRSPNAMLVIGLTGTIGSGKSEVARILQQEGVPVLSSDAIAHAVMNQDADIRTSLRHRFGEDIIPEHAPINRQALAQLLFGPTTQHEENRRFVEQLVHPRVLERIAHELDQLEQRGEPLVVVESALIYEVGIEDLFDYIVVVAAPESLRRERVRSRNGSDEDFIQRQRIQYSDDDLRARADFVIENTGTLDDLHQATQTLLAILRHLPPRPVKLPATTGDE